MLPEDNRINHAFLLLYGREPTAEEIDAGTSFLQEWDVGDVAQSKSVKDIPPEELGRWQSYVQVLLMANEFIYVD